MLKFTLILTCFWLVECRFMHPYYGKSHLRHSRKYYYSLNKPPPDFDPIYNYAKDDQRAQFQCPEDERQCSCPFQYRDTAKYECYHDTECPENHKCCPDSCYVHEICKAIVTKTSTESTTTTQRPATEKCTTTTQTEEFTEPTSEEITPVITVTESTTLVTEREKKPTSGSTTTENQLTEEISKVTNPPKTETTLTVLRTTAEITREPIPEPEFVPEATRSESTTQTYVGTTARIVSTTKIKRKPTQVPLPEPEVIEADESGSGTFDDDDDDEERGGRISTISTITSKAGTNSDVIFDNSKTTRKLTASTSSQHGKDLVSDTEKPKIEFVSELTKLESTTAKIDDKRSTVLGTTEIKERPKLEPTPQPEIIEASGSGDGTIDNDDEDEEKRYTKSSTVPKSTPLAAKIDDNSDDITFDYSDRMPTKDDYNETTVVPITITRDHTESTSHQHGKDLASDKSTTSAPQVITTEGKSTAFVPILTQLESTTETSEDKISTVLSTNEIKEKQTVEPIPQPEVIEASGSGDGTTDTDDEESTDAKDLTIQKSTPLPSQTSSNSDDIIFDNSDRNFEKTSTKDGDAETTRVPTGNTSGTTQKHVESTSNKGLTSNTEEPKTEFLPGTTKLENTTVPSTTGIKQEPSLEPIPQPEIIEASGSGDGTTFDDEDDEKRDTKDSTIKKSTPLPSQTSGNTEDIIFDFSDSNFEKITKSDNKTRLTVGTTSATKAGTTREYTESTPKVSEPDVTVTEDKSKSEFLPKVTKLESTTETIAGKTSTKSGTTDIKDKPKLEPIPQPEIIEASGSGDGTTYDDEDEEKSDTKDSSIKKSTPLPSQTRGNTDDIIFDFSDSNFEKITKSDNKTRLTVGTTSATEAGTTREFIESTPKVSKPDVTVTKNKSKPEFLPTVTKLERTTETIEGKTSIKSGTTDIKDKPKLEPIPQPDIIEASGSGDGTTSDDEDEEKSDTKDSTIKKSTPLPSQTSGNSDDIIFDKSDSNFEEITKSDDKTRLTVGTTSATEAGTTRQYTESIPKVSKPDVTVTKDKSKSEFLPKVTIEAIEGKTSTKSGTTDIKDKPKLEPIPQPEIIEASGSGDGTTYDDEDEEKRDTKDSTIKKSTPLPSQTSGNSDDIIFDKSDSNFEEITKSDNKTRLTVGTTSATEAGTTREYTESTPKVSKPDVTVTEDKSKSEFLPEVTKLERTTSAIAGTTDMKGKPKVEPIPQPEIIEASGSGDGTTDDEEISAVSSTIDESTRATIKTGGSSEDIIFEETTRILGGATVEAVTTKKQSFSTALTASETTKVPTRISVGTIGTKVPLLTTTLSSRIGQADNGTDKMILPKPDSDISRKEVGETAKNQDKEDKVIDEFSGDNDDEGGDDEDFGSGALLDTDKSNIAPRNKQIHEEEQKNNAATINATDQRSKDERMKRNRLDKRTNEATTKTRDALDELGGFFEPDYEILD